MGVERPVILLIENDESDVFMFRRALAKIGFRGTVRVVNTLAEARRYLLNCGEFTDKTYFTCPDLIVSDMNVFGYSGNDLFVWARNTPELKGVPFVFLSGSYSSTDKQRADELGADGFFTKTGSIDDAVETMRDILKRLATAS
jgi:DNA-binding response OmpR family regulator